MAVVIVKNSFEDLDNGLQTTNYQHGLNKFALQAFN